LRSHGLDLAFIERARLGFPTMGICGGYQMFGGRIVDGVESGEREVSGLDLLPIETVFEKEKLLSRPEGRAPLFGEAEVSGYEIRHGRVFRHGGEPLFVGDGLDEGCRVGALLGTSWHGVMESDGFRRSFLRWVAEERGLNWRPGETSFAAAREARLERLGDLISENVDQEALLRLIDDGPPSGLPVVAGQLVSWSAGQDIIAGIASCPKAPPSHNDTASDRSSDGRPVLGYDENQRRLTG
jgi:adenosylcobyric acid synthase